MSAPGVVLITGAGGFVGAALAEGFAALGWHVTGVDVAFDASSAARLTGCRLITTDLGGPLTADLPDATLVIHAAAITTDPDALGWTAAAHIAANTRPLLTMLEYAARTRPAAFVFVSSSGVFAPDDGHGALTDHDVPNGRSAYAVAKRAGEMLTSAALAGIAAAHVVRLGYLYGPHETARPSRSRRSAVAGWVEAAFLGRPLTVPAGDPARDWTFTPDLAPVVAGLAALPPAGRPVHLCSPHVLRDSVMAGHIAAHVPGAIVVTGPDLGPVKPPLRGSDLSRLSAVRWTTPERGVAALVTTQVSV